MELTYFTCTLGEAKLWKAKNPSTPTFNDVVDLIDQQARRLPQSPATGFAHFQGQGDDHPRYLTFAELARQSSSASRILREAVGRREPGVSPETIGLLCTSSVEFLLVFLGLLRLGYSVLFLAPQLKPKAITHLCSTLGVHTIYTDDKQEARLTTVKDVIQVLKVPSHHEVQTDSSDEDSESEARAAMPEVAYWCHTSGTSSGLPKPIPQTHYGVVAALPSFSVQDIPATYSTTPLYHGGIVDGFRAWTSGAMIWYFPEGTAPITNDSVLRSLRAAQGAKAATVRYFSSVPYILQLLADDKDGLAMIQTMELVGVGGAALPESVGDRLVDQGVHLLSRMGSAECGFLMSSHRDYHVDKRWQSLRPVQDEALLSFEPRDSGLSELVVKADWPFLAKTNRSDGSFATSDLFEPSHDGSSGASWRYHSRADAQITLSNGKKFDPAPMEAALVASTHLIRDALIFGAGKDYSGVLLVPDDGVAKEGYIDLVWPYVQAINDGSQNHSRLSKSMIVVIDPETENATFEKSSKGTLLRRTVEERFSEAISGAYSSAKTRPQLSVAATYEDLSKTVRDCFDDVLGRHIEPDIDVFLQGVDSLSCMQIRGLVQASCVPSDGPELPLNVVYDQSTLEGLSAYLWQLREGKPAPTRQEVEEAQLRAMEAMARELACFEPRSPASSRHKGGKSVVLTGATGFLGGWVLKHLIDDPTVETVVCLVRAPDESAGRERIYKSLQDRGLESPLDQSDGKVKCWPCDLAGDNCGLSPEQRDVILRDATLVIHSAWAVNFNLQLASFRKQVSGTRNLAQLSLDAGAHFVFISSTAAVSEQGESPIAEKLSANPSDASALGYSRSKWVAEQICASVPALSSTEADGRARTPVTIIRVGQLCGDLNGVWNASEAYPLMLSTARLVGCLPNIPDEPTNWVPVHHAARAILEIAEFATQSVDRPGVPVFHVANPHDTPTWEQMLDWILGAEGASTFTKVPPDQWVEELQKASLTKDASHPCFALLNLWKTAFGAPSEYGKGASAPAPRFDVAESRAVSSAMKNLRPLSEEELVRMWHWVKRALE